MYWCRPFRFRLKDMYRAYEVAEDFLSYFIEQFVSSDQWVQTCHRSSPSSSSSISAAPTWASGARCRGRSSPPSPSQCTSPSNFRHLTSASIRVSPKDALLRVARLKLAAVFFLCTNPELKTARGGRNIHSANDPKQFRIRNRNSKRPCFTIRALCC